MDVARGEDCGGLVVVITGTVVRKQVDSLVPTITALVIKTYRPPGVLLVQTVPK